MIKKILFPVEFANFDRSTYKYALTLAKAFDASIVAMHAYGSGAAGVGRLGSPVSKSDVEDRLLNFIKENTPEEFRKVEAKPTAIADYPTEGILSMAKEQQPDLIIMSTQSRTEPGILHLSDQVLTVIRKAESMVLAVPEDFDTYPIDKLVFSTNFEFNDLVAINMLKSWADLLKAELHVLHIGGESAVAQVKMRALEQAYSKHDKINFEFITGSKVKDSIAAFTETIEADMVVFTTHKRSFLDTILEGSVTQNVAKTTRIPMLTIKQL